MYLVLADLTVAVHVAFLLFLVVGATAAAVGRRPMIAWLHLPVLAWGLVIACRPGTECPLTPLEKYFWRLAGHPVYEGAFRDHYVTPAILQHARAFGAAILLVNLIGYGILAARFSRSVKKTPPAGIPNR